MLIEGLCSRHYAECLLCLHPFYPWNNPVREVLLLALFIDNANLGRRAEERAQGHGSPSCLNPSTLALGSVGALQHHPVSAFQQTPC